MNGSERAENKIKFQVNGREFAFKMTYHADNTCDRDLIHCFQTIGICEPEVVCAMERIVRPGDIVIDGGANIGFFTIYLSMLVGEAGKVIAIEPGENNLWKLEANVRLNGLRNVEIVRKPLWAINDEVTLYMRSEGGRNSLFSGNSFGANKMETCTLADFPGARLIKLDIEGAEVQALDMWEGGGFVIAEMNEEALNMMGTDQDELRANGETFLLQKDGSLPIYVSPRTRIVTNRQNLNILLSTIDDVAEVWKEVVA
jgi:FkbM family methyltransferase